MPINLVTIKTDTLLASDKFIESGGAKARETFKALDRMSSAKFFYASGEMAKDIDWNRNSIYKEWENAEGVLYGGMVLK